MYMPTPKQQKQVHSATADGMMMTEVRSRPAEYWYELRRGGGGKGGDTRGDGVDGVGGGGTTVADTSISPSECQLSSDQYFQPVASVGHAAYWSFKLCRATRFVQLEILPRPNKDGLVTTHVPKGGQKCKSKK